MIKKIFIYCLTFLFSALPVFSQSSEKISAILNSEKITCGQLAYLAGTYTNEVPEDSDEEGAFEILAKAGYFPAECAASTELTLKQTSFVLAKAVNLKGGLLYTLTGSPRYAFRELKAIGALPSSADPDMKLSGRDALGLMNSLLPDSE